LAGPFNVKTSQNIILLILHSFTLGLFAFLLLVTSAPTSCEVSIKMTEGSRVPASQETTGSSNNIPTFNDERIKAHPDKVLLNRIRAFFKAFTTGDFDGMRDLQSKDYTMTNIREKIFLPTSL
jgi:hypothetical protein